MMTKTDELDLVLARLGAGSVSHPALSRLDAAILSRLAQDRRKEGGPLRLGLAAAASALAAAAIGGGASVATAQSRLPAPALSVLGPGDGLAPSSLLLPKR
jgi:hypothetical protein